MPTKKPEKKPAAKKSLKRTGIIVKISAVVLAAVLILLFVLTNRSNNTEEKEDGYMFKKEGELAFADSAGNTKVKIDIEVADNEYERQLGLMNRKVMDEKQGMLFIFPVERFQAFWMRNTLIPLDMIFVNSDHKVVTIHKNTEVLSDKSYPSDQPAKYVVEVIGGFTDKYNIELGDKVNWMGIRF